MPLIKGKSPKAFEHNVKAEMTAGKPQDQSLAIAYSVKRKAKKKMMAEGGAVNESAKSEHQPMPEERDKDASMVSRNSSRKDNAQSGWTDQPTMAQAKRPSLVPLSRPKMANGILKVRDRADAEAEEHMMSSMPPESADRQPAEELNEEGAMRQGPAIAALKMKKMAEGGMINEDISMKSAEEDEVQHPAGLESDDDMRGPAQDEYMANRFAEGGMAEEEMDHADSIAAAIMARKERAMMAEGGILSHDSIESDDSSQADLSRNADEDANEEDQLSFNALRKENYSESEGLSHLDSPMDSNEHGRELSDEDAHDMVSQIRNKMARQRQFKVR